MAANKPHVLVVPLPVQGHLKPLMTLCRQIAKHGIKVTFVNAQSVHQKIIEASNTALEEDGDDDDDISLASLPDGLKPDHHPNDSFLLLQNLPATMPTTLPDLIENINRSNRNEKISCVIADLSFGWVLDIAERMGLETVGFSPPSMATTSMLLHIPKLIEQGDLDTNGSMKKLDLMSLSDDIPAWRKDELPWSFSKDLNNQKIMYECIKSYAAANKSKWLLCNTCYELEPAACDLHPNFMPVGPLHLHDTNTEKSCSDSSNFYTEDASCLSWLDKKPAGSVVYVSFGSLAVWSQQQLDELAFGLELSGRAFLWVIRKNLANGSRAVYPDGFLERVSEVGKIVEWAPQNKVLSHRAIACFVSHCGWNSTLEGVSKGVPFLCWPCFAEQAHNASYICDNWGIGLRLNCDDNGMRSRYEIKNKIDMLLSGDKFKKNAFKLKEMCAESVGEGGSAYKNLTKFIDHLRKCGV